jgi:AcrR family transcriptional regulator
MSDAPLTADAILNAAEDVFRRYGPTKTTVVDVARALNVSHGTIYRHYASKADLRDAVVKRWLDHVSQPLAAIALEEGVATEQLQRWLRQLMAAKHQKAHADPELFATYQALSEQARAVVYAHINELVRQVTLIVERGVAQGEFNVDDPLSAAQAIFHATTRFHHPVHASTWNATTIDDEFVAVWRLILLGLQPR